MPDVAQLGVRITADDRASKTLDDVSGRLRLTQSAFEGLSATTVLRGGVIVGALLGIGAAAAKMAEQGVHSAADLEHSVANISTIKPDIDTTAVFKSLNDMQTRIPQTAKELGDSLYDVFSSIDNVTEAQGLRLVETFAKGATAAQTDAKTFGTAISGVLNAYKLNVDDAAKVSDVFFNTVNRGVVTGPQLASSLGPAVAAAKALGVSYEEAFALIVGATKEGGDAAQNINNITNLLSKLPTAEATADLNALGIATQDVAGNLRKPIDLLTDLKTKLDGMTEAARATTLLKIFPDIQARQGAQVVMSQLDIVKVALAENRTATNSTADAYAKMAATAVEQGKLLQNTWTALLTDLSVVALPALVGALGVAGGAVRELRQGFQDAQPAIEAVSAALTPRLQADLAGAAAAMQALGREAQTTGGQLGGIAAALGRTPAGQVITAGAEQAGIDWGDQFRRGVVAALPGGGAALLIEHWLHGQGEQAAAGAAEEGKRIGADFVDNLATQIVASGEADASLVGAAAEGLIREFEGRGFSPDVAREAATLYMDALIQAIEKKQADLVAVAERAARVIQGAAPGAGGAQSAALVARDLEEARHRQQVADLGGAVAIRAHTEALHQDEIAQLGGAVAIRDHADQLQRQATAALGGAVAVRAHEEALTREHEAELGGAIAIRTHEEALARQKEQALGGAVAIRDHEEALTREQEAALGGAAAIRDHAESLTREHEQALGGALAIRDHAEALAQEHEQALGGALAIRAHDEALAQEKEQALGGALAIRDHAEALQREHDAALGGALGIRAHEEALAREHEQALGGVLAIRAHEEALAAEKLAALGGEAGVRAHAEALERQRVAALGGAVGMRAHEEALARDKEQALGGALAIRDHAEALQREHDAGLGGAVAIRAHAEALAQEKEQALGGALAIRDHEEQLQRDREAALGGVAAIDAHTEALRKQRLEAAAAQAGPGSTAALRNAIDTQQKSLEPAGLRTQLEQMIADTTAMTEALTAREQVIQGTATTARELAAANASLAGATALADEPMGRLAATSRGLYEAFTGLPLAAGDIKTATEIVLPALESAASRFHLVGTAYHELSDAVNGADLRRAGAAFEFELKEEARAVQLLTQAMGQLSVEQQVSVQATIAQSGTMAGLDQAYGLLHKSSAQLQADLSGTVTVASTFSDLLNTKMAQAATTWAGTQNLATQALVATRIANHDAAGAFALTGQSLSSLTDATKATTAAQRQLLDVGTGLATHTADLVSIFGSAAAAEQNAAFYAKDLAREWGIAAQNAKDLVEGINRVGGFATPKGLNFTQIMGGSGGPTASTVAGGGTFMPTSAYGIPIVSPLTPGTLRGFAGGGWITEPSYIVPTRTGRPSALAGEAGPEYVGGGGQTTVNVTYAPTFAGGTGLDKARVARELAGAIGDELSRAGFRVRG